jgi:hypothetical protein
MSGPLSYELVHYNAACKALAEAKAVDEAKKIRDVAEAMRVYAQQAKNKQLEIDAMEIRLRAERRVGELIVAQKKSVGLNKGTRGQLKGRKTSGGVKKEPPDDDRPTLADVGIDKKLSSVAQKLAAMSSEQFEVEVGAWRERFQKQGERVTAKLVRAGKRAQKRKRQARHEPPPYEPTPDEQAALDSLERALKKINDKISPDTTRLLYKLDIQEKHRWVEMFEPLAELYKNISHLAGVDPTR